MIKIFLARYLFALALYAGWCGDGALAVFLELWAIYFGKEAL